MTRPHTLKILRWVASSRKDFGKFPQPVQHTFGFELYLAQTGQHPPSAKPMKAVGSGVIELIEDFDGDTFRAVYAAQFEAGLYVLHCFKKKSKSGVKTPQTDIELIRRRLRAAEADNNERLKEERQR